MKAIVYDRYGPPDVLRLEEIDRPVPAASQMLVRVRAASVNALDWHFLTGLPYVGRVQFGLRRPKGDRLGADFAGEVESVGAGVTEFRPGDAVFGQVDGEVAGHRRLELGALAEYVCVSEYSVVAKPAGVSFEEAAAAPVAGLTALQGLRDQGRIQPGQQVLINGASGGVGTFAVQIAKWLGAEVTGVCSTRNIDLVRSMGADQVVDYTVEDFATGDRRYDVILDNVGNRSLRTYRRALQPKGIYVASFGQPWHRWLGPASILVRMSLVSPFVGQKMITWVSKRTKEDLVALRDLMDAGDVTPIVDRTYPLHDTAEAMRYLAAGHARAKVVVTV